MSIKRIVKFIAVVLFVILGLISSETLMSAQTVYGTINNLPQPFGVAVNPQTNLIYVTDFSYGVHVIDGTSNSVIENIPTTNSSAEGIAVNPITNLIYVPDSFNSTAVIDGSSNSVVANITVGTAPNAVAVNPITNRIYVTNRGDDSSVSVIDGITNSVIATIPVGHYPRGVAVNTLTNRIYVASIDSNSVSVIDGNSDTVITTISVSGAPFSVAVNSATNRIYVTENISGTVDVIDGITNSVVSSIPIASPQQMTVGVNPTTNRLYVTASADSTVTIVNTITNTILSTVSVGVSPGGGGANSVGVNPITNYIYIPNYQDNSISVIYDPMIAPQIISLNPAKVWVGLRNSDDVGTRFDLKAEVYKNGTELVGFGQLDSVWGGSSGFNNANLQTIPFNTFTPVDFPQGSTLSIKLYVRNACIGPTHNSGTARLWYDDASANSQFDTTIGEESNIYFLRNNFVLSTQVGSGPKQKIDVKAGSPCSPFKTFGTWSIIP